MKNRIFQNYNGSFNIKYSQNENESMENNANNKF